MRFPNSRPTVALVFMAVLGLAVVAQTGANKGFNTANLDTSCKACDDFYHYANGGWLKNNPIPPAFSTWGTTSSLNDHNIEVLHQILEEAAKNTSAPAGSNEQKIGAMYASCMDTAAIEAAGAKPLQPGFALVEKLKTTKDLPMVLAAFRNNSYGSVFGFGSTPDQKDSRMTIAALNQGGTSLPDRDYYLNQDDKSKTLRDAYVKHVAKMFVLAGDDPAKAATAADTILSIETKIAQNQRDRVANRDPDKRYNKMSVADLQKLTPDFDWAVYFKEIKAPKFDSLTVGQPEFFQNWDKLLANWDKKVRANIDASPLYTATIPDPNNPTNIVVLRETGIEPYSLEVFMVDTGIVGAFVDAGAIPATSATFQGANAVAGNGNFEIDITTFCPGMAPMIFPHVVSTVGKTVAQVNAEMVALLRATGYSVSGPTLGNTYTLYVPSNQRLQKIEMNRTDTGITVSGVGATSQAQSNVPTLSEWGLVLLAALVAIGGALRLRLRASA